MSTQGSAALRTVRLQLGSFGSRASRWQTFAQVVALGVVGLIWLNEFQHPWRNDAWGYWIAWDGGLYDIPWLDRFAYTYSPAFAQAAWPWTLLPWELAWGVEVGIQIVLLVLIVGPILAAGILLFPFSPLEGYANPVMATVHNGNIQLLLALGVVAAYRWPAAWLIPIHMKVTPGIGVLWYVVRREWRRAALAVGATALVAAVSFAIAPALWFEWSGLLLNAARADTLQKEPILQLPLMVRLPAAALLIAWGAWTNRYWTVPVGAMLALPAIQYGGFAVAVGAIPFLVTRSARLRWLIPGPLRTLWRLPDGAGAGRTGHPADRPADPRDTSLR